MTVDHAYKVTAPLIKAITNARNPEDLSTLKETNTSKKKGKVCDVGTTEDSLLLEMTQKTQEQGSYCNETRIIDFSK